MHGANIAVRMTARGLLETYGYLRSSGDVLSQGAELPASLRRGMALVSAVALRDGYHLDIGSQVNAFTAMTGRPVREWGPRPFAECVERDAVLLDLGHGIPTQECYELAELGSENNIAEDIFHERLRSCLSALSPRSASLMYMRIREAIVRRPVRTRADLLAFAQEHPEASAELPGFFRPLPGSALDGGLLRLCGHCGSPLYPRAERRLYPLGRCEVRECRMSNPEPAAGSEHLVQVPSEWRMADPAIMTYWVGPGLPEIALYDALRKTRSDVELYPMSDMADVGVGGLEVGIDVKSYSSAAVLGQKFARGIGGLRAFKRRIVAIPDFWISIDRDYIRTASAVSGLPERIEFLSLGAVVREFAA